VRRRRYEVTEMYALIDISNQMLEDSAFDMEGEIRGTVRAGRKPCSI
jgi:HK97 family phage major capsid protein